MDESKKLKRGLKDISPLFMEALPVSWKNLPEFDSSKLGSTAISLFFPEKKESQLELAEVLARKIQSAQMPCGILDFSRSKNFQKKWTEINPESISIKNLTMGEFEALIKDGGKNFEAFSPMAMILNFDETHSLYFEKLVPLLDKMVLVLRPTLESLTEIYRLIKMSARLNPRLEYFLVFETDPSFKKEALFFEPFSEMISRRLDVDVTWLGTIESDDSGARDVDLSLSLLFDKTALDSVEKRALARFFFTKAKVIL